MSLWTERFNSHPLWANVAEARARVNRLVVDPDDRAANDVLAYVGQVIENLERRREDSFALEVTPGMLDGTTSAVANWIGRLDSVIAETSSLPTAVDATDTVLQSLASWPPMRPARYFSGVQTASDALVEKMRAALDALSEATAESDASLAALTEGEAALGKKIDAEKQRIAEAIAEFSTESSAAVDEWTRERSEAFEGLQAEWAKRDEARDSESQALIEQLKAHEATAKSVVHASTAAIVATDYGRYARNKTWAAWTCDVVAAIVGAAGVAAILLHLYTLSDSADGNVGLSITRLAASLGTLGIAALIGRRGAQHHREARAAKRTDLSLRQVGPFIADLPKDEQQEIILDFTERVFIRGDLDSSATEPTKGGARDRILALRADRRAKAEAKAAEG